MMKNGIKNNQIKINMEIKKSFNPNYFSYDIKDLNSFKKEFRKEISALNGIKEPLLKILNKMYGDRLRKELPLKERESILSKFFCKLDDSIINLEKLKDKMCDIWDVDYTVVFKK